MDVKPPRRRAPQRPVTEAAPARPEPARPQEVRAAPELPARDLRRLLPLHRGGAESQLPSASPDALWAGPGRGRGRLVAEARKLERELRQVEQEISVVAQRMEATWEKGDARFRAEVVAELEVSLELTPELRAQLADDLATLAALNEAAELADTSPEARHIDEARLAVTSEVASKLKENGAELELLQAVERAAGEDGQERSLVNLVSSWFTALASLFSVQTQLEEQSAEREEDVKHEEEDLVRFEVRQQTVSAQDRHARVQVELVKMAERRGIVPSVAPAAAPSVSSVSSAAPAAKR